MLKNFNSVRHLWDESEHRPRLRLLRLLGLLMGANPCSQVGGVMFGYPHIFSINCRWIHSLTGLLHLHHPYCLTATRLFQMSLCGGTVQTQTKSSCTPLRCVTQRISYPYVSIWTKNRKNNFIPETTELAPSLAADCGSTLIQTVRQKEKYGGLDPSLRTRPDKNDLKHSPIAASRLQNITPICTRGRATEGEESSRGRRRRDDPTKGSA